VTEWVDAVRIRCAANQGRCNFPLATVCVYAGQGHPGPGAAVIVTSAAHVRADGGPRIARRVDFPLAGEMPMEWCPRHPTDRVLWRRPAGRARVARMPAELLAEPLAEFRRTGKVQYLPWLPHVTVVVPNPPAL
jgi:hypothetical protein